MSGRYLLLQARDPGDPMLAHEKGCFGRALAATDGEIVTVNVLERLPTEAEVAAALAVFMGGSGDFSVVGQEAPWFRDAMGWARDLAGSGKPVFASCFGIQLLARSLGGEVVHDYENKEIGTFQISLTDAGRRDPLFSGLPERFWANCGHQDRVAVPPPGTIVLAGNDACPVEAFRLVGKPVYATQFHPELREEDVVHRVRHYAGSYRLGEPEVARILEDFRPISIELGRLLPTFLDGLKK